jgi:hypothetical protein
MHSPRALSQAGRAPRVVEGLRLSITCWELRAGARCISERLFGNGSELLGVVAARRGFRRRVRAGLRRRVGVERVRRGDVEPHRHRRLGRRLEPHRVELEQRERDGANGKQRRQRNERGREQLHGRRRWQWRGWRRRQHEQLLLDDLDRIVLDDHGGEHIRFDVDGRWRRRRRLHPRRPPGMLGRGRQPPPTRALEPTSSAATRRSRASASAATPRTQAETARTSAAPPRIRPIGTRGTTSSSASIFMRATPSMRR